MAEEIWKPHTTVAALCQRDGKYLMVKEMVDQKIVYNQPAGHLEPGESLLEAIVRETLEETRYRFTPVSLQGVYRFTPVEAPHRTYLRFLFRGDVGEQLEGALDQGIIAAEWLSYEEVLACGDRHRTPMVLQCIEDARNGPGFPLQVISQDFA